MGFSGSSPRPGGLKPLLLALGLVLFTLPEASAQDGAAYLADLRSLAQQQQGQGARDPVRSYPVGTIGVQSGFGLGHGSIGFGAALTNRRDRVQRDWDGSAAVSFGFGDARAAVGAEVTLGLVSTTPPWRRRGNASVLGEDGNLSLKLFREFHNPRTGQVSAVSVGASNLVRWGDARATPVNYFIAGSTTFSVPWSSEASLPGMATLGIGSAVRNIERDPGIFGGVALGLAPWLSVGASWLGDEAMVGVQLYPRLGDTLNLQVGLYYADATRRVSPSGRFVLNVGVLFDGVY